MDGHPWLAASIDFMMRPLYPARRLVVPEARGDVLEIGVGTGLNFGLYGQVDSIAGVEPDPFMLERARKRAAELSLPIELHQVGAEALPFDRARFDTVVVTFTLCTIPDVDAAMHEIVRVLRPGGTLHFVEHGRSEDPKVYARQVRFEPIQKRIGGGCHLTRDAAELALGVGLEVTRLDRFRLQGPKILTTMSSGTAVRPG